MRTSPLSVKNTTTRMYSMTNVHPLPKIDTKEKIKALLYCPRCKVEMPLFGIESESDQRDLYTFECVACSGLEVRGVLVKGVANVIIPINK
jgi:hypothetical protein